ncbi:KilA-N domain-containing protein [Candidatus Peregrinibacteria bacterium]|nr:KilA-N domain-containing protein [Candidatus Peregrinibacteria bacterium]
MTDYKINVKGTEIIIFRQRDDDYISLTDIARYKDPERSDYILQNWMRNRGTIEFLGLWEKINNPNFNSIEFDGIKSEAGLNSFSLTPKRWVNTTKSIGIISKTGRYYSGTFAHKDIAFEFASWISPEFKLYLIKEFQRLKEEENGRLMLGWDIKRNLAKINYKVHTDAIKAHLIPNKLTIEQINFIYSSEADVLNKALFNLTAKEWRNANPKKDGNIRDYADIVQLICLSNLESFNAEFIRIGLKQNERLVKLNEIAIIQMRSLINNPKISKLEKL